MASYFDEHDTSTSQNTSSQEDATRQIDEIMLLVRLLVEDNVPIDQVEGIFGNIGEQLAPPASKEVVDNLKKYRVEEDDINNDLSCPVCLLKFSVEDEVIDMPCNHKYHTTCILPWLKKTNSCALCRYELPTDDKEYEKRKKQKKEEEEREQRIEELHNSMFG